MNAVTPAMRKLAQRLIARESARSLRNGTGSGVVQVCDKLRGPLAKLAGVAGFRSLLTRAVALAAANEPWLKLVQVLPDGTLGGFDEARQKQGDAGTHGDEVVAQLLGLLDTFIGEPLTLRLVSEAWPEAAVDETNSHGGGRT